MLVMSPCGADGGGPAPGAPAPRPRPRDRPRGAGRRPCCMYFTSMGRPPRAICTESMRETESSAPRPERAQAHGRAPHHLVEQFLHIPPAPPRPCTGGGRSVASAPATANAHEVVVRLIVVPRDRQPAPSCRRLSPPVGGVDEAECASPPDRSSRRRCDTHVVGSEGERVDEGESRAPVTPPPRAPSRGAWATAPAAPPPAGGRRRRPRQHRAARRWWWGPGTQVASGTYVMQGRAGAAPPRAPLPPPPAASVAQAQW